MLKRQDKEQMALAPVICEGCCCKTASTEDSSTCPYYQSGDFIYDSPRKDFICPNYVADYLANTPTNGHQDA